MFDGWLAVARRNTHPSALSRGPDPRAAPYLGQECAGRMHSTPASSVIGTARMSSADLSSLWRLRQLRGRAGKRPLVNADDADERGSVSKSSVDHECLALDVGGLGLIANSAYQVGNLATLPPLEVFHWSQGAGQVSDFVVIHGGQRG